MEGVVVVVDGAVTLVDDGESKDNRLKSIAKVSRLLDIIQLNKRSEGKSIKSRRVCKKSGRGREKKKKKNVFLFYPVSL